MVYLDIVSGFLGAGKTTFVNALLDFYFASGERPVYIVNEYGEAALDAEIMKSEGFEAVEMTNGCICCTLKGNIVGAIADLIGKLAPTRIVFEPSGVFIFDNFFDILNTPPLKGKCDVGNIITVIDGINYKSARLVFGNFIYNQIQSAPILFVSKLDKAPEGIDLTELLCDVRNINPHATVVTKKYNELTEEFLAGLLLGKPEGTGHGNGCECPSCRDGHGEHCGCGHEHGHHHHAHHEALDTVTIEMDRGYGQGEFSGFIESVRSGKFGDVVRAKGIVFLDGKPQLLNMTFDEAAYKVFTAYERPAITFIGRNLDRAGILALAAKDG